MSTPAWSAAQDVSLRSMAIGVDSMEDPMGMVFQPWEVAQTALLPAGILPWPWAHDGSRLLKLDPRTGWMRSGWLFSPVSAVRLVEQGSRLSGELRRRTLRSEIAAASSACAPCSRPLPRDIARAQGAGLAS